jgi:hypothetical protein
VLRFKVKVVLLAFRPVPPLLSATVPLNVAGTVAAVKLLPAAGVVTDTVGAVASSVKVMAVPVKVLPALSVAVACTVYVPLVCEDHVGSVALLVHVTAVLLVVALCVVARLKTAACQAVPVQ